MNDQPGAVLQARLPGAPSRAAAFARSLVVGAVKAYQLTISPFLSWRGPRCRFYPSCSTYCVEAVMRFGVVRGIWLAVKRLAKCHPFHPGGLDPVPSVMPGTGVRSTAHV